MDQEAPLTAHALELLEVEGSLVLGRIPYILEGQHPIDLFLDFPEPWLPQRSEALVRQSFGDLSRGGVDHCDKFHLELFG